MDRTHDEVGIALDNRIYLSESTTHYPMIARGCFESPWRLLNPPFLARRMRDVKRIMPLGTGAPSIYLCCYGYAEQSAKA